MQAPGFRFNEREANPNPYVGFIRALKQKADHDDAEHILKAVAAQMKKIMEQRFMFVHTLEEAAYNRVFAGRNWNYGQSIELVLRGPGGNFLPLPYIISVMCHEMAHIQQMNHGPKFQKLNAEIKADVRRMQAKGNYGDGFWSDGHRLRDSTRMGAQSLRRADLPEYVCGVTAGDATKATRPRRKPTSSQLPGLVKGEASHRSGRQTDYNRKTARRNNADMGVSVGRLDGRREITKEDRDRRQQEVNILAEELVQQGGSAKMAKTRAGKLWDGANPWFVEGNTRGKVAKSKTAAEMRAEAAEKRLLALSGVAGPSNPAKSEDPEDSEGESGSDDEEVLDPHMGPEERKRDIENDTNEAERKILRDEWEEFFEGMNIQARKRSASPRPTQSDRKDKVPRADSGQMVLGGFGRGLVKEETKRGLGLASGSTSIGGVHRLGGNVKLEPSAEGERVKGVDWACKLCTFINGADQARCEMCNARPDGTMPEDVA